MKTKLLKGLSHTERKALLEFRDRLMERFDGEILEVFLYGSRARGEGHEESDLDAAVLVRKERPELRRGIYDLAAEIFLKSDITISPLVISKNRFEWLKEIERGIALDIAREGIKL